MKTSLALAVVAQSLLAAADAEPAQAPARRWGIPGVNIPGGWDFGPGGWGAGGGGPFGFNFGGGAGFGPAGTCVSNFWATATPAPTAFCDPNNNLKSCISSAYSAQSTDFASYSSKSSSLCSEFSSCDSTGTYTYTFQTPDSAWGINWADKTFPTGTVTYTGCQWSGDGWGFPFWHGLGYGDDFWSTLRPGWTKETITTTVTAASSAAVVTLERAVSGGQSTVRTLGAGVNGPTETGRPNAAPTDGAAPVKVMGAALGAVLAGAALL